MQKEDRVIHLPCVQSVAVTRERKGFYDHRGSTWVKEGNVGKVTGI